MLRSISSNVHSAALDADVIPEASYDNTSCANSTSAESNNHHHTTSSMDGSSTSKYTSYNTYATTTSRMRPPKTAASLSFRQYILMPLFFFLALLLAWVAPSTNRVAAFADPTFSSYPLMLMVGITGSLRGFWNGIVFVVVGMRSWKRRKESDEMALRPVTRG